MISAFYIYELQCFLSFIGKITKVSEWRSECQNLFLFSFRNNVIEIVEHAQQFICKLKMFHIKFSEKLL